MKNHTFNRDASFIIIEQIRNCTLSRETKKNLLKQRENFWILKLETLKPKSLNQEKKRSNECASIVRNLHFSPVCFDQSNSPLS